LSHFRTIWQSQLFRISSLNSVSVLLKIGVGLITSKVLAYFVGPSGMALVGNLRNFVSLFESISLMGFQNGIIRFVASHQEQKEELKSFFSTVFFTVFFLALLLSTILFFGTQYWTAQLFSPGSFYEVVIQVFAITLPWQTLSVVMISLLNGLGKYRKVIIIQIIGNLIGLLVAVVLITQLYTLGALLALIIAPALLFLVNGYFLHRELPWIYYLSFKSFQPKWIKELSSFTLMALFTAIVSPLVYLFLRNHLIHLHGLHEAGEWEAMLRLSTYYMMLLSTLLTVYFLPKLSQSASERETGSIFLSFYKWVLPVFGIVLLVLLVLRDFVIRLVFNDDFIRMGDLFFWQLTGDFFKAASIILGYEFYAKKLVKSYILTEFISFASLGILGFYLAQTQGAVGMVEAYAYTYMIYFLVLLLYFRKPILKAL
jgi:O-antigen/teichoic acid export membrane protein